MTIKKRMWTGGVVIFISIVGLFFGNYYAQYAIEKQKEKLVIVEKGIGDALKTKLKHFNFVVKFEEGFIKHKKIKDLKYQ